MTDARKKTRVTVDLSEAQYGLLTALESAMGDGSTADVIRDALRLYAWIADQHAAGGKVQVVRPDGSAETVVLLNMAGTVTA